MSQVISAFRRTAFAVRNSFIDVASTRPDEVIEITDRVRREVDVLRLVDGVLNVQTLHTTTGVIVNEDEPLLHGDLSAPCSSGWRRAPAPTTTTTLPGAPST